MRYRLAGLRHDGIVSRHHDHGDVGGVGTALANAGKRFVTGRVQKGNHAVVGFGLVRADVLGDATRFFVGNSRAANIVEQTRFAVVNVSHYRDHRRT